MEHLCNLEVLLIFHFQLKLPAVHAIEFVSLCFMVFFTIYAVLTVLMITSSCSLSAAQNKCFLDYLRSVV